MAPRFLPNRPIAHRGLHDVRRGVIENTASAFRAAIAGGYGIETDIQAAAGGEPVIFHDERLERLTGAEGTVAALTPDQLRQLALRNTADRILTLAEFLRLVEGRAPLYLEIKSLGGADRTLERRVAEELADYRGPVSVISFDRAASSRSGISPATCRAACPPCASCEPGCRASPCSTASA